MEDLETKLNKISILEQKCREILLYDFVRSKILEKDGHHDAFCSLLDFLGDSNQSLETVTTKNKRKSYDPYVLLYFLLQTCFSRVISLRHVLNLFDLYYRDIKLENNFIEARDCVIGHPTHSNKIPHVVIRSMLDTESFSYVSYKGKTTIKSETLYYENLIHDHLEKLTIGLNRIYNYFAEFENKRRKVLREDPFYKKLVGVEYLASKIYPSYDVEHHILCRTHVELLRNTLSSVKHDFDSRLRKNAKHVKIQSIIDCLNFIDSISPINNEVDYNRFDILSDGIRINVKNILDTATEFEKTESEDIPLQVLK